MAQQCFEGPGVITLTNSTGSFTVVSATNGNTVGSFSGTPYSSSNPNLGSVTIPAGQHCAEYPDNWGGEGCSCPPIPVLVYTPDNPVVEEPEPITTSDPELVCNTDTGFYDVVVVELIDGVAANPPVIVSQTATTISCDVDVTDYEVTISKSCVDGLIVEQMMLSVNGAIATPLGAPIPTNISCNKKDIEIIKSTDYCVLSESASIAAYTNVSEFTDSLNIDTQATEAFAGVADGSYPVINTPSGDWFHYDYSATSLFAGTQRTITSEKPISQNGASLPVRGVETVGGGTTSRNSIIHCLNTPVGFWGADILDLESNPAFAEAAIIAYDSSLAVIVTDTSFPNGEDVVQFAGVTSPANNIAYVQIVVGDANGGTLSDQLALTNVVYGTLVDAESETYCEIVTLEDGVKVTTVYGPAGQPAELPEGAELCDKEPPPVLDYEYTRTPICADGVNMLMQSAYIDKERQLPVVYFDLLGEEIPPPAAYTLGFCQQQAFDYEESPVCVDGVSGVIRTYIDVITRIVVANEFYDKDGEIVPAPLSWEYGSCVECREPKIKEVFEVTQGASGVVAIPFGIGSVTVWTEENGSVVYSNPAGETTNSFAVSTDGSTVYYSKNSAPYNFYSYDIATGVQTLLCTLPVFMVGMTIDPDTGLVYFVEDLGQKIWTLDLSDCTSLTNIVTMTGSVGTSDIAFIGGELYGIGFQGFFTIDLTDSSRTTVCPAIAGARQIADAGNGFAYFLLNNNDLWKINLKDCTTELVQDDLVSGITIDLGSFFTEGGCRTLYTAYDFDCDTGTYVPRTDANGDIAYFVDCTLTTTATVTGELVNSCPVDATNAEPECKNFQIVPKKYCVISTGTSAPCQAKVCKKKATATPAGKKTEVCELRKYVCGEYEGSTYIYNGNEIDQATYDALKLKVVTCDGPSPTYNAGPTTCATLEVDIKGVLTTVVLNCTVYTNAADPSDSFTSYTLADSYTDLGVIGDGYVPLTDPTACPAGSITEDEQCYEALVDVKGVANTGGIIKVKSVSNAIAGTTAYTIYFATTNSVIYTGTDPVGDAGIDVTDASVWVAASCVEADPVSTCCPTIEEACALIDGEVVIVSYGVYPDTGVLVGWFRNTETGALLAAEPAWTDCCGGGNSGGDPVELMATDISCQSNRTGVNFAFTLTNDTGAALDITALNAPSGWAGSSTPSIPVTLNDGDSISIGAVISPLDGSCSDIDPTDFTLDSVQGVITVAV